jgi:hypothetical protein
MGPKIFKDVTGPKIFNQLYGFCQNDFLQSEYSTKGRVESLI